ncbi:hypothetical protein DSL72_005380 [Monilinia vaccinii-corymbosi]|uniref:Uncharacterized protein n=1 Tax=Monilinia vaccinii-corymbosi TaxID=61207 RepID=A0A8A3PF76_9HELO|nr:hypothetical protein DSL72_005380 [Monilinia vaccinii-corymbosi]
MLVTLVQIHTVSTHYLAFHNDAFISNKKETPKAGEAILTAIPGDFQMYGKFLAPGDVSTTESEAKLKSEKYWMLLKDSIPDEDSIIPSETTSSSLRQDSRTVNPPLPALAKEVLWYGHEKKFNRTHHIPYSPFITRYQKLSASVGQNEIDKRPPVPESSFTRWMEKDLQDAKHKKIAQLVSSQIKEFENAHVDHDRPIMSRQFEGSIWFNKAYDDAMIDYYDAREDQIELDNLRFMAWKAGARWRHAELSEYGL